MNATDPDFVAKLGPGSGSIAAAALSPTVRTFYGAMILATALIAALPYCA
jgi:hypothetical protein